MPFPPGSSMWPDVVDEGTRARALELLELLPPWSYVDEGPIRFFCFVDGDAQGVGALLRDGTLGDAPATATPTATSSASSPWLWLLGLGGLAAAGYTLYRVLSGPHAEDHRGIRGRVDSDVPF